MVLVVSLWWQIRKQRRLAAKIDAVLAEYREAALVQTNKIIDNLESYLERRISETLRSSPDKVRPIFLATLNENLDDTVRYSKEDFILAADAIFRTIAMDFADYHAERFPPASAGSLPAGE
jgi:hypothetical protein